MKKNLGLRLPYFLLAATVLTYVAVPVGFYCSSSLRRLLIFGAYIRWPFHDYTQPESYGLPYAKNFYVNSVGDTRLGVWYIPPKGNWPLLGSKQKLPREPQEWMIDDGKPIIIYYHGHAQCRACDYRLGLYKVLTQNEQLDAHVFTFDYRGFGDSTSGLPGRSGVLQDSVIIFEYVRKLAKNNESRIILWGHSLGTSIVLQIAEALPALERNPRGIVLEAPFSSLVEAAMAWPLSIPYRYFPGMSHVFEILRHDDSTSYESGSLAWNNEIPVLFLHSPDDGLVSFDQGRKLFTTMKASRLAPTEFYEVDTKYEAGHRHIYIDPKVPEIVAQFFKTPESNTNVETSGMAIMSEKTLAVKDEL